MQGIWQCENGFANVNFAKAVNFAMRNGFAKFAKWVVNFAMRNFAQVGTNEQCIGIAKLVLALRNWLCEIFALRMEFGIAKLALRTHCEFRNAKFRIGFVRGNFRKATVYWVVGFRNAKLVCEHFAKFAMAANCLRTVCENLLLLNFYAFCPVFNCISFSSLFL